MQVDAGCASWTIRNSCAKLPGVRLWIVVLFLLAPISMQAQECMITLPVGIFSKDGLRIPALGPKDFLITVDKLPIQSTESSFLKVKRFVVVLDASPSMRGESIPADLPFEFARAVALRLIALSPAESSIGLITFGSGATARMQLTADHSRINQAVLAAAGENRKGQSPMWDSLAEAHKLLVPIQPGDFVVVLTDGGSNSDNLQWQDIAKLFMQDGVRVFPIILTQETPRTLEEYYGPNETDRLARQTGGLQLGIDIPTRRRDLSLDQPAETVATRTLNLAGSYYGLRLRSDRKTEGKRLKVKLVDPIAKITLMHPEKLPSCQTNP